MTLNDYLSGSGETLEQFGRRIDRSASTVSRIARGEHRPDWATMEAIEAATGGQVTPNDFRADPKAAAPDIASLPEGQGGVSAEPAVPVSTVGEAA